jgi:large subunit ribosomal protein L15
MTHGLNTLKRYTQRSKPSVGRGGKRGKTSGRGTKGQNARAGHKKYPEIRDVIKKLPKRRGYGKNRARTVWDGKQRPLVVTLTQLEKAFKAGDAVNPKVLVEKRVIRAVGGKIPEVKILATGSITKKLTISDAAISAGAKKAIEEVGGTVAA